MSVDEFQSTLPVWGVTWHGMQLRYTGYISIHTPRVGSDQHLFLYKIHAYISIHTPRVGSDERKETALKKDGISIHTPRVGSDLDWLVGTGINEKFQSTLPVWGVTRAVLTHFYVAKYFNPHSPCGE